MSEKEQKKRGLLSKLFGKGQDKKGSCCGVRIESEEDDGNEDNKEQTRDGQDKENSDSEK
ncbi:hypothetical protein [Natranaerobius thermophilus]|uniref:Uncharacterized protein n=1 Tax=Natranaerobius thermophilus (strain ATCC BAA-1301 / DSM 18059 / JW/NM-WN-LF) TaxID=457570 RepID=B2A0I8_NATTJ|nr:hypothetical protein [Natranaerobius thermophilus]ACB84549.1 hypothetical protein Nther_0965 [Natranaerobius thermophilus JW/NM-WN-LF]